MTLPAHGRVAVALGARHRLRPQHWALAAGVGLLLGLLMAFQRAGFFLETLSEHNRLALYAVFASRWTVLMTGVALVALPVMAALDELEARGLARRRDYAVASVLLLSFAAFVLEPLAFTVLRRVHEALQSPMRPFWAGVGWFQGLARGWSLSLPMLAVACAMGGGALASHAASRRGQQALAGAQWRLVELERRVLAEQLQGAEARVDPVFLFQTLSRLEQDFVRVPSQGRSLLQALIRFLRAALPPGADAGGTLAQQAELLRAYLEIVSHERPALRAWSVTLAQRLGERPIAPFLLLPLVRDALDRGAGTVHLHVESAAGLLLLRLADDGDDGGASTQALHDGLRQRLLRLYGQAATLQRQPASDGRHETRLAVPEPGTRNPPTP